MAGRCSRSIRIPTGESPSPFWQAIQPGIEGASRTFDGARSDPRGSSRRLSREQISPVGVLGEKRRQLLREAGRAEPHREALLLDVLDHRRRIEVRPGVIGSEDERRLVLADENAADDQGAGPVVALDEQLGPAEQADVQARSPRPHRLAAAALIPLDDIANPAVLLLVEPLL